MLDNLQLPPDHDPTDGAPTWLRILQAAAIGVAAGFALNALLSVATVEGQGVTPKQPQKECKKPAPAKDAVAPGPDGPTLSSLGWIFRSGARS
jgi:hypothetical protein